MRDLITRLIGQLDELLPFISVAHKEVFSVVGAKYGLWFSEEQQDTLPESFDVFERQIAHGAFLIGYSYVEAFLSDLVREIYLSHPQMLPRNRELRFYEVLDQGNYKELLEYMIEKEVFYVFHGPIEKVGKYLRDKLHLPWPDDDSEVVRASLIRNCLLHNMGCVDRRLAEVSDLKERDEISLRPQDVHEFGWLIRGLAPKLFEEAKKRHFGREAKRGRPSSQ